MALFSALSRDLRALTGVRVWANAPLAPFTTIGTGGKARLLVTVTDTDAVASALRVLRAYGVPWFCLGAGSDLLVADRGYPGVALKLDQSFQYVEGLPDTGLSDAACEPTVITVGAGVYLARLAAVVAEAGLSGLEFACGIPGTVGEVSR